MDSIRMRMSTYLVDHFQLTAPPWGPKPTGKTRCQCRSRRLKVWEQFSPPVTERAGATAEKAFYLDPTQPEFLKKWGLQQSPSIGVSEARWLFMYPAGPMP